MSGEKVQGLRLEVPATRGEMGGVPFYNFLISPQHLLKIGYVSHKSANSKKDTDTYQRIINTKRLKNIGAYIDDDGQFPTNIVINIKTNNDDIKFKSAKKGSSFGSLVLPANYGCAWIIDGQHRLYSYEYADRGMEGALLPVLAYVDMPVKDEIELFVKINHEQVSVQRNLIEEIQANINWNSPRMEERLQALHSRLVLKLNELIDSPFKDRVKTLATDRSGKDKKKCLTLTNFVDGVVENNLVGKMLDGNFTAGPLGTTSHDLDEMLEKATRTLAKYFYLFASELQQQWDAANNKALGGYVATNLGVRALLKLFGEVSKFVERNEHISLSNLEPDDVIKYIKPYVSVLLEYLSTASSDQILAFSARGSSKAGVTAACNDMLLIIGADYPEILTPELKQYLEKQDVEGTKEARDLIDDAYDIINNDVIRRLKEHYGESEKGWWMQGVPTEPKNECDRKYNLSDGSKERWQFLDPRHYQDIVGYKNNQQLFSFHYDFIGKGRWPERVRWLGQLAGLRTITHHREKWPATKVQVREAKYIYSLVVMHIRDGLAVIKDKKYMAEFHQKETELEANENSD